MADDTQAQLPRPDPALRRLDRFVGTWSMEGHLVGSDDVVIKGQTTFRWRPGGFFLEQHGKMNFMGMDLDSVELIGYDPETGTFPVDRLHEHRTDSAAVPVGGRRRHSEDLCVLRPARRDVHRQLR